MSEIDKGHAISADDLPVIVALELRLKKLEKEIEFLGRWQRATQARMDGVALPRMPSTGSFLGYHDASGNEMHCRHMTCPHEIDCRKRCICPTAVTSTALCAHKSVHDGPRVEAVWGTVPTQVCDCGMWRTMHHAPGSWQAGPVPSKTRETP